MNTAVERYLIHCSLPFRSEWDPLLVDTGIETEFCCPENLCGSSFMVIH